MTRWRCGAKANERSAVLIGVFGSPSPLSYWMFGALRTTVELCFPHHFAIGVSNLSQLREAVTNSAGAPVLCFCDCPEVDLAQLILESGAPYLISLEAPLETVGFCAAERGLEPPAALRLTVQCLSALQDLAVGPNARHFVRNRESRVSDFVLEFCRTFRLTSETSIALEAVRRLSGEGEGSDPLVEDLILRNNQFAKPLGIYSRLFTDGDAPAWIGQVAKSYLPISEGRSAESMLWPREAFFDPTAENRIVLPNVDLIGPSRALLYGPYLHLPRGLWRALFGIEVSDASSNALTVDVALNGAPIKIGRINLPGRGRFEFSLDFEIEEPRHFVEFRIVLLNGAIEGKVSLSGVSLVRVQSNFAKIQAI